MTTIAQPNLFAPAPPAGDASVMPQLACLGLGLDYGAFTLRVTGRHVIGTFVPPRPNPRGRRTCRVDYHRTVSWTDAQEASALRVAAHWFALIGGFAQLSNRQLCHIVARLKAGHSEDSMHWAIDAYACAEWQCKNGAWTTLGHFFLSDKYDQWLEDSKEYKAWQARQAEKRAAAHESQQRQAEHTRRGELPLITSLTDEQLLAQRDLAAQDALAGDVASRDHEQQRLAILQQVWDMLTLQEKARSIAKARAAIAWTEADPAKLTMQDEWFRFRAMDFGYLLAAIRLGDKLPAVRPLADFTPPLLSPYRLPDLDAELRRRQPNSCHDPLDAIRVSEVTGTGPK